MRGGPHRTGIAAVTGQPSADRSGGRTPDALAAWLLQQGLAGAGQTELLQGYCERLVELGIPLLRVHVAQRAFHPQFGGIGFDWLREGGLSQQHFEHRDTPLERWLKSPLYHILQNQLSEYRERLIDVENSGFSILNELKQRGGTDYLAKGLLFEPPDTSRPIDPNNTPEGILISWTSDGPSGFSAADIACFGDTLPYLGLALKSASNRQMARDLLGVYLGADAGNRVLSGEIRRGSVQQIRAVICYFDLTGFTSLAEQIAGDALIEMLNAYFGLAVGIVEKNGGHVLKFMGDGLLALFGQPDTAQAAAAALNAAAILRDEIGALNAARRARDLPTTGFTLALHAGEISYGNIGAENRLDFTAIGPAVNLAARLSGMHRSLGQNLIISDELVRYCPAVPHDLVSLGRYMLRGVSEPRELFTIYLPPATEA